MGDTGLFGDRALIGQRYRPDLLLIPIGGRFVLDPSDAAEAPRMVRPHFAIPIHYRTTAQLAGTPEQYIAVLDKTATEVKVLQPGETAIFDQPEIPGRAPCATRSAGIWPALSVAGRSSRPRGDRGIPRTAILATRFKPVLQGG